MAVKNKVTASSLCKLLYNKIAPRLILRFGLSARPWQNVFSVCAQQNFTNYYFVASWVSLWLFRNFWQLPKGSGLWKIETPRCWLPAGRRLRRPHRWATSPSLKGQSVGCGCMCGSIPVSPIFWRQLDKAILKLSWKTKQTRANKLWKKEKNEKEFALSGIKTHFKSLGDPWAYCHRERRKVQWHRSEGQNNFLLS